MKKLHLLFIGVLSMSTVYAQDISDAIRFSQDEIQGSARFRALSGAFGALGGDMSAVSLNPAGSAVFSRSHASFSLSNKDTENKTQYFNGMNNSSDSNFDINQGGAAFVFASNTNSSWRKFTIAVAYERTNDYDSNWRASGVNTDNDPNFNNSIASYFYDFANGLEKFVFTPSGQELVNYFNINNSQAQNDPELYFDNNPQLYNDLAYEFLGNVEGFSTQQAFLGFQGYLFSPDSDADNNTDYTSNIAPGSFDHDYIYTSTGYNGKITFNMATQYEDNLYLGLNLNSHFINYDRSTLLFEDNSNPGSIVNSVEFENGISTRGSGFSFQLGGILKLTNEFRVGLTYDSPTWYTIEEETTQYLATVRDEGSGLETQVINPNVINIHPQYRLQTPAKLAGSLAYVFGKLGLISFDYSRKDYSQTKFRPTSDAFFADQNNVMNNILTDAATYRLGGEYKHKQLSFRGGYRFEESPYIDGVIVGDLTGYSLGIGYNFGNTKLDITYDRSERSFVNSFYNLRFDTPASATVDRTNSNITLSLSFNI
ncbi:outer membrane protein transport protein [Flavivirga amylovorans]|uniref:Outer membrane protein transport protein n=1 Tax=Flavivirga amylovorans TaxID=870486 RepID=A0ABT8X6J7_9FLAO|nr:outer membrane protein transport protein [Flavivirga amylovorans]MDO5989510.1 outer membrane protein transport protein [Flavivirga amylovorans]